MNEIQKTMIFRKIQHKIDNAWHVKGQRQGMVVKMLMKEYAKAKTDEMRFVIMGSIMNVCRLIGAQDERERLQAQVEDTMKDLKMKGMIPNG
jgi:hypothetical protein